DWTRFSVQTSQANTLGCGRPSFLNSGTATIRSIPTHPEEATNHGVLLMHYPGGGTVDLSLNVATSAGGSGTTTTPSLVGGGSATGIDTDTTEGTLTVNAVTNTGFLSTIDVDDASGVSVGDVFVSADGSSINTVQSVAGNTIRFTHLWATPPSVSDVLSYGPRQYVFYELPAAGSTANVQRGLSLTHSSGGGVAVIAIGYCESTRNDRIAYIPAGRGGWGYQQQSVQNSPNAAQDIAIAMGVELIFAGVASQDIGRLTDVLSDLSPFEIVSTPDVTSAAGTNEDSFELRHADLRQIAVDKADAAYLPISDEFGDYMTQLFRWGRHDAPHPNGRGMHEAADLWWSAVEADPAALLDVDLPAAGGVTGGSVNRTRRNIGSGVIRYG
ncbi:MAG: hypothetical protein AAGK78_13260, partial [Planctomycetota bacterium]